MVVVIVVVDVVVVIVVVGERMLSNAAPLITVHVAFVLVRLSILISNVTSKKI